MVHSIDSPGTASQISVEETAHCALAVVAVGDQTGAVAEIWSSKYCPVVVVVEGDPGERKSQDKETAQKVHLVLGSLEEVVLCHLVGAEVQEIGDSIVVMGVLLLDCTPAVLLPLVVVVVLFGCTYSCFLFFFVEQ